MPTTGSIFSSTNKSIFVRLEIPAAFIHHFNEDRFRDSLFRLYNDAHFMAGRYEKELAVMLAKSFQKCEVII